MYKTAPENGNYLLKYTKTFDSQQGLLVSAQGIERFV